MEKKSQTPRPILSQPISAVGAKIKNPQSKFNLLYVWTKISSSFRILIVGLNAKAILKTRKSKTLNATFVNRFQLIDIWIMLAE